VSALLVRALERCSPRHDTRFSRVAVDLLGPVPVTDQLWVRASVERPGTKIELLDAEMLAPRLTGGTDRSPRPSRGAFRNTTPTSCSTRRLPRYVR
jgi:hypothetical protein